MGIKNLLLENIHVYKYDFEMSTMAQILQNKRNKQMNLLILMFAKSLQHLELRLD